MAVGTTPGQGVNQAPKKPPTERKDICGVTHIGGTGMEWICIKKPHGKVYNRNKSSQRSPIGAPIFSNNPSVDSHYYVRKYPMGHDVSTEAER